MRRGGLMALVARNHVDSALQFPSERFDCPALAGLLRFCLPGASRSRAGPSRTQRCLLRAIALRTLRKSAAPSGPDTRKAHSDRRALLSDINILNGVYPQPLRDRFGAVSGISMSRILFEIISPTLDAAAGFAQEFESQGLALRDAVIHSYESHFSLGGKA